MWNLCRCLCVWLLATMLSMTCGQALAADEQRRPHIILIEADDMGFDDVSFRGSSEFLTPNIDALAYHGRILDRLYAPALGALSRGALLTGRYPLHMGSSSNSNSQQHAPWALSANVTTLAEVLSGAGYATALVGKWHLGFGRRQDTPTHRGFDQHYGFWGGHIDYYSRRARLPMGGGGNGNSSGYDWRRNMAVECAQRGAYVTDDLTAEAERIIRNNNDTQPLFLWLAHLAPHAANEERPMQAPDDEVTKFAHIKQPARKIYAAMISKLDESVGRVIAALEQSGMLANSIVIFHSDNGAPSVGRSANTGSNWPLRGQKNTAWEGGVRVAGAIWSPLIEARATIYRPPIYVGDWLPTLAAAANIQLDTLLAPSSIDGIDQWPALVNYTAGSSSSSRSSNGDREIVVRSLDEAGGGVVSYMRGSWKYVRGTTANGAYDNVLTYREEYDLDPRAPHYHDVVRRSPAALALAKYAERPLTSRQIGRLRRQAAVQCGDAQRSCNALIEECLFDVERDPCEQNNVAALSPFAHVLDEMRMKVAHLPRIASTTVPGSRTVHYDPAWHQCLWTNYLDEPPAQSQLDCELVWRTYDTPCALHNGTLSQRVVFPEALLPSSQQ